VEDVRTSRDGGGEAMVEKAEKAEKAEMAEMAMTSAAVLNRLLVTSIAYPNTTIHHSLID
jgi:hypothetical protein